MLTIRLWVLKCRALNWFYWWQLLMRFYCQQFQKIYLCGEIKILAAYKDRSFINSAPPSILAYIPHMGDGLCKKGQCAMRINSKMSLSEKITTHIGFGDTFVAAHEGTKFLDVVQTGVVAFVRVKRRGHHTYTIPNTYGWGDFQRGVSPHIRHVSNSQLLFMCGTVFLFIMVKPSSIC